MEGQVGVPPKKMVVRVAAQKKLNQNESRRKNSELTKIKSQGKKKKKGQEEKNKLLTK